LQPLLRRGNALPRVHPSLELSDTKVYFGFRVQRLRCRVLHLWGEPLLRRSNALPRVHPPPPSRRRTRLRRSRRGRPWGWRGQNAFRIHVETDIIETSFCVFKADRLLYDSTLGLRVINRGGSWSADRTSAGRRKKRRRRGGFCSGEMPTRRRSPGRARAHQERGATPGRV